MSDGDDDTPDRPARAKVPAAAPRPKPPVPRANAQATPAPPREPSPSVEADPEGGVDEGWLAPEDAAVASLAPPAIESTPSPPIAVAPPIAPAPASNPFLTATPESSNPFSPMTSPSPIASPPVIAEVERAEQTPVARADAEPAPRKRSRAKVLAFVLFAALILVGGGFAYQAQMKARSPEPQHVATQSSDDATARVEPPPVLTAQPRPPATHTAESPPSSSAPKKRAAEGAAAGPAVAVSADPSKTGILDTTALPAGRKIMVDGRVLGTSPRRVPVRCGRHQIQIGDLPPESLELPCGGEITFNE
jgi:hypothetical protein